MDQEQGRLCTIKRNHNLNLRGKGQRGKSKITFQCSNLAMKLHSASLLSADTTRTATE